MTTHEDTCVGGGNTRMSAAKKLVKPGIDRKILKSFIPLGKLSPQQLTEISEKSTIIEFARGRTLFRKGDVDKSIYYLVSGEIEFVSGDEKITIKSGSKPAKNILFNSVPRPVTAIAKTKMSVLCVDSGLLEVLLGDFNHHNYEVNEIEGTENKDWMTRFIQSLTTLSLPAKNMQALMMRMKEVSVKAGDTVIQQFDNDKFYYIVKHGRCVVSRRASSKSLDVKVTELDEGDGFGEEALISNDVRTATVKMINDGTLMRLEKKDFIDLLASPVLRTVPFDEINSMVAEGALLLDVRDITEHAKNGIINSINIPSASLRAKLTQLDNKKKYIVYSENDNKSSAAAFLLAQAGYENFILEGGISSVLSSTKAGVTASPDAGNEETSINEKSGASVVSLHPEKSISDIDLNQNRHNLQNKGKLKLNGNFAVNIPDGQDLAADGRVDALAEREKARIAQLEKEVAEAEVARLREEIDAKNVSAKQKNTLYSAAEQELIEKLNQERERNSREIAELKSLAERNLQQKLEEAQQEAESELVELRGIKQRSEQELAEFKRTAEQQLLEELVEARKSSEQEIEAFKQEKAHSEQELEEFRKQSEQQLKQHLGEVRQEAERELNELKSHAEGLRDKYEEESSKLNAQEEVLESSRNELRAALDERDQFRSDNELLAEEIESVFSRVANAEKSRQLAFEENDALRSEMEQARNETQEHFDNLLVENNVKLENELNEIKARMTDEKNKAAAAEKALHRAKEKEAKLRAEADASRSAADKEAHKLALIQEEKILELEEEIFQAEEAERLQVEAEQSAARFMEEAEAAKKRAEIEAKKYAVAEAAGKKALEKSKKNIKAAELARERAQSGTSRLRAELEATRASAEEALRKSSELDAARQREERNIKKQSRVLAELGREEEEKSRIVMSERARKKAEDEVEKLKAKLESQKKTALALAQKRVDEQAAEMQERERIQALPESFSPNDSVVIAPELLADIIPSGAPDVGNVRKSGWISDALLWETTLGMREDEEAEQALAPEEAVKPKAKTVKSEPVAKPVTKKAKPVRANPNASTFAVRDVSGNGPVSQSISQRAEMPDVERGSSKIKKLLIASSIAVIAAIGVGAYIMTSGEETKLPGSISGLLDKAKSLGSDEASIDKPSIKRKSAPKTTATQLKINKERAEMKSRNAAQVEFSKLKKNSPVISQSSLESDTGGNEAVPKPVVSQTPAPGVNTLPAVTQEGVPVEPTEGATVTEGSPESAASAETGTDSGASSKQSGDTANEAESEAGDGKSTIEMTIDSLENAAGDGVKEEAAMDELISE